MKLKGRPASNLAGQRFGLLVAQERAGTGGEHATWRCLCDCGRTSIARAHELKSGHTRSCGCRRQQAPKAQRNRKRAEPEPVAVEHREKAWRGAEDATAKLTELWGVQ